MENKEAFFASVTQLRSERGVLFLREVEWPGLVASPILTIEGFHHRADQPNRLEEKPTFWWHIECDEPYQFQIESYEIYSIGMPSHHPLLWGLSCRARQLHFVGKPGNPDALIGALLLVHEKVTDGLLPFISRFNANSVHDLISLLDKGHGVIARGPEDLLRRYAAELDKYDCKTSIFGGDMLSSPASEDDLYLGYKILVWERNSFVIAEEFTFTLES